jgi:hypothetical protein
VDKARTRSSAIESGANWTGWQLSFPRIQGAMHAVKSLGQAKKLRQLRLVIG